MIACLRKSKIQIENNSKCEKVIYTAIICYMMVGYGITCTSVGPCLVDLKHIFQHKDMQYVFYYNSINSVGYVCGSLCGFLYKILNRQLCVICLITTLGLSLVLIPHSSLIFLYFCGFVIGVGGGSWDCAATVWIIEMWDRKSGPILQLSNFAFGIGSIIGPLIANPFIIGEDETTIDTVMAGLNRRSKLVTPFSINGCIQIFGALMMLFMFLMKKYEKPDMKSQIDKTNARRLSKLSEPDSPIRCIVFLGAMSLATFTAVENSVFQFSPTFNQFIPLKLCAANTALILSLMASSFTIGRGLSVFIAIKLKPQTMLSYHFCMIIIAIIMLLFAQNSILYIYIGNILIGLGLSALWSAMFAYMEQYLVVTDKIGTSFIFATGLMSATSPLIIGPYIQDRPMILIYFYSFCTTLSIFSYLIMNYLINRSLVRIKRIEFIKQLNNNNKELVTNDKTINSNQFII